MREEKRRGVFIELLDVSHWPLSCHDAPRLIKIGRDTKFDHKPHDSTTDQLASQVTNRIH
jgi:hypothetical protein